MGIETVTEELICLRAIAFSDGEGGAEKCPAGQGDADGDERFFSEATGEFLEAIFFVEISAMNELISYDYGQGFWYVSPSKEEGRGASDMTDSTCYVCFWAAMRSLNSLQLGDGEQVTLAAEQFSH